VIVELASGRHVTLPESYLEESTSHGYALTVFRSQGITVDHAFLLGNDALFQEAGYTGLSRGRLSNHLYAVTHEDLRSDIAHTDEHTRRRDALGGLVASLSQSREQTMAIGTGPDGKPDEPDRTGSGWEKPDRQQSTEAWFQEFGRELAQTEEKTNKPPEPERPLAWSRSHDRGHDRDYGGGFGL
jgi:hypothetical protein